MDVFDTIFNRIYDTKEIRRVARKISGVEAEVNDVRTRMLKNCQNRVEEGFQGEAANALKEQLEGLGVELNSLADGLNSIAGSLERYARRLEENDAALARLVSHH